MPQRKSNAWFPWNEVRLQSRVSSFSSRSLSKICNVNDCCIHACSVNYRACTKTRGSICICAEMQLRSWFLCLKDILLLRFYRALYLKTLIKGTLVSTLKPSEMEKSAVATHFTDLNAENDDSSSLRAVPLSSRHWTVSRVFLTRSGPLWGCSSVICWCRSFAWCPWSCLWGLEVSPAPPLCSSTSGTGNGLSPVSLSSVDRRGREEHSWLTNVRSHQRARLAYRGRVGGCCVTLTWRICMVRLMKFGELSVLVTSTSISPKLFFSLSQ